MLGRFPVAATVPSTDLDRSGKFYEGVLGLEPARETAGESRRYECANGTMLEVYMTRADVGAGHTEVAWLVDDIEAVVASLREAGVTMEEYDFGDGMRTENGIMSMGDEHGAWFKDPDGNVLGIFQSSER